MKTPPDKIFIRPTPYGYAVEYEETGDEDIEYIRADTIVKQLVEALEPFAELSKGMKDIVSPYERGMDLEDLMLRSDWLIDAQEAISQYHKE